MELTSLEQKIKHARSVHEELPKLEHDFISLLERGMGSDKNYLIYYSAEGERSALSYRDFYEAVLNTSRFYHSMGLKTGDKIATISHNHWHSVVQYFAAWFSGLVVVPINLGEDDHRISYILQHADVKLAMVRAQYASRIGELIQQEKKLTHLEIVVCDESIECFTKPTGKLSEAAISIEDEALIVFTSGTTGNPKGVVLTQRNLLEDARSIAQWHNIDVETRMMCVLPIHHVNGTVVTMITPFFAGGSTVLNQKFSVAQFFKVIETEQVHMVSVVPTLLQFLNGYYEDKEIPEYSHFRHIICGAGPLTVKVAQNFEEKFKIPIIHGYGLSETTCYSCFLPVIQSQSEHQKWMRDYGYPSIGVAIPANDMDIQDEQGKSLPVDKRGEIVARGVNVMKGYFNNPEANEHTFKNGWFRSGDEGFYKIGVDGERYYFITGRLKELIIRGGINLAPLEIDEIINKAPGVKAGIAVGFENDWYGEEVGALVQLKEGSEMNEQAILDYCQKYLPYAKAPKVVVFGDSLPVTSTGKYQRLKVAHLFKEWKSYQFRE